MPESIGRLADRRAGGGHSAKLGGKALFRLNKVGGEAI